MKPILTAVAFIALSIAGYCQSATLTENKLLIPNDSKDVIYNISRTDVEKVGFLSSNQGQILSYTIAFAYDGSYFSKAMSSNEFDLYVKRNIISLPVGTKIFLMDITIKGTSNEALVVTTATFQLID